MSDAIKKMLIIISKGDFKQAYQGLVLANGALMEGKQAELFFTFDGLAAIQKELPESMMAPSELKPAMSAQDMPEVSEFLDMIRESGGKLFGCKLSIDMLGVKDDELRDDLEANISVGEFYDRAIEDSQIIYV